jgi:hypothetical protein
MCPPPRSLKKISASIILSKQEKIKLNISCLEKAAVTKSGGASLQRAAAAEEPRKNAKRSEKDEKDLKRRCPVGFSQKNRLGFVHVDGNGAFYRLKRAAFFPRTGKQQKIS